METGTVCLHFPALALLLWGSLARLGRHRYNCQPVKQGPEAPVFPHNKHASVRGGLSIVSIHRMQQQYHNLKWRPTCRYKNKTWLQPITTGLCLTFSLWNQAWSRFYWSTLSDRVIKTHRAPRMGGWVRCTIAPCILSSNDSITHYWWWFFLLL